MPRLRLSAVLLVLVLAVLPPSGLAAPPPPAAPAAPPVSLEEMIARVKPAVTFIAARGALGGTWSCSGFIYDASGYVLTNHHCVDAAAEITITLPDRRTFRAALVDYMRIHEDTCPYRTDTWVDAAILKIDGTNLPTIPLGESSTLRQGQELYVLGYPQPSRISPDEVSVSRGIVSAVRPGWVQTDAVIIGGNSGGPVVDRLGRAVGLAAFLAAFDPRGGSGFGGVVHMDRIRPMAAAALSGGTKVQAFSVTGLDYVPPVTAGRRRAWRDAYEPGATQTQAQVRESASEVAQVQNFSGTFVYTVRGSDGTETRNLLDADGLKRLSIGGGAWRYAFPDGPLPLFVFPPCVGLTWRYRYVAENPADGTTRTVVATVQIASNNDSVSVPAGNYPQTIRITTTYQGTDTRGGQQRQWREVENEWWAPGVGTVRSVTENPDTRQRWISDLISTGAPVVAAAPPAPSPAPPPPPEPTPPAPPPAPEAAKTPAPNDRVIEPGSRVGAVRIGDSLDEAIKIIGEVPTVSSSQRPGQPGGWIAYQWKNRLYAFVEKDTRTILRAGVWAPNPQELAQPPFRARGISIGSTVFDVTAAFGQPEARRDDESDVVYIYNRLGIAFYIGTSPRFAFHGQVWDIRVFKPGTW